MTVEFWFVIGAACRRGLLYLSHHHRAGRVHLYDAHLHLGEKRKT